MEFICEVFTPTHDASGFDSGQAALDTWLRQAARDSDARNLTRTYIWHQGDRVVLAYYTLMPYVIERQTLSRKQGRGLPERIAGYLLARLALHRRLHGHGLGSHVLASALTRAALGARDLGGRFVIVDALDDNAAAFYRHHGFDPIPGHPQRLILPTAALDPYLP